ncbi:disease resistance protein RPV1-like isoform X2 [Malus domestica]|uniref:disease resistance protein RPV1-like isoform X2 n=1 Tax=Malus domestica TaxID=3750 RepID=UPI0039771A0E
MTAHEASSSSSSKSKLWNYDVFLSFRGEDTRKGFTGHLHAAFKDRGYQAYMDEDDLKRGEEIKDELFRAIEESRISIIVFSKRYADSSWCLDELVKIMECRSKLDRHVLPIFYHVDPSHVRKQDGDLAEAFQKHKEGIGEEKDGKKREAKQKKVGQWREALTKAANLSGHHLQITDNGHEANLIREIVDNSITKWLMSTNKLNVAKHPVGIDSRIQDIISYLSSGGSNVVMVGVWGMGGLGKTTTAKAIYNQIHHKFQFKSFMPDISNTASKHGLVYLQEKLISDILTMKSKISSVDEGIGLIEDQFQHRRVLVIMDNIDEVGQLDAIVGNHNWFGPGSRIIITTRDKHLLKQVDKTYPAQKLNEREALELFSWHAFGNNWPNEEYLELSEKVVSYCGGLPLGLEVLGSFLFKRPIAEWKSQLEKLKRTPEGKIIKSLRISFEGLDDTQKAIFLDISCFFIGRDKDYVAKVLDGCGFSATIGISVLRELCLVTVEQNVLNMHDLFREMARVIISEKSLGHPGKWSRLWDDREVIDVLTNKSGTEEIEGLAVPWGYGYGNAYSTEAFANMKKLRLLQLSCVELKGEYKHLPKKLIWLCWIGCPLKSIPDDFFNQDKLIVLEMQYSKLVQVWEGSKSLHNLKTLDLTYSRSLEKSPDFSQVPNLEELILEECISLSEIHPSIGHLKRLSLVNLSRCNELISLPKDFYKLKSVETLLLNGCSKFIELHEDIGQMISLRTLAAYKTVIREVPPSIVRLKNLTCLSLSGVGSIHLPHSLHGLNSLRELDISCCGLADNEIPGDLGSLISLQVLDLSRNNFHILPNLSGVELNGVYKHLPKELIWLHWEEFPLKSIPDDIFNQDKLVVLDMQGSKLVQARDGSKSLYNLKTLDLSCSDSLQKSPDFSQIPNLEELILEGCSSLSEIHPSIGHLKKLSLVNLTQCWELISLPRDFYKLKSVKTLLLNGCSKFIELHEDIGEMISLRTLEAERTSIREVPPSIVRLKNLTGLSLDKYRISVKLKGEYKYLCWDLCPLKSIPDDFFNQDKLVVLQMQYSKLVQVWEGSKSLYNLKTLDLSCSDSLQKSPDFSQVPNLEELILEGCSSLSEIHPSIGHLKKLSLVNLTQCWELISLPRDFYKLKSVETLLLNGCSKFIELHEDIGEMISLRTLEAERTSIREVPPSIVRLKNLTGLSLDKYGISVKLKGEYKYLCWDLCPLKSIPDDFFNQDKLVVLQMQYSKLVQVWEGSKSLRYLKTLDLSYSWSLQKSPDFSQVPNLEELILEDCYSLSEIHPSIGHLKGLSLVNLRDCRKLISLPRDFYKLKSVETLLLNGCWKFRELHEDIGDMISLRTLEAEQTAIREVPPSIVGLKNLTRLSLDRISCIELNEEYKHLPKELIWLRWFGCPLKSIPDDFFNQDKLVVLQMQYSKLVQVWEGSKSLHNLKTLDLSHSYSLQKSPDFSQVPNLEELILVWCKSLSEIHPSIGHLKRLSLVNLKWCFKLISLPRDFYKLKSVEAECTSIREVPPSIVKLKNLTRLSLLAVKSIHLPHSLHGLNTFKGIKSLMVCKLADDAIPKDLGSLISLQDLNLQGNDFHTLPSLSGLSKLETLRLDGCFNLRTIHDIPPNVKVQHE